MHGHCGACVHMYSCSCLDSAIHNTVCKHSHLVHMKQKEWTPNDEELLHIPLDLQVTSSTEVHFNSDYYFEV